MMNKPARILAWVAGSLLAFLLIVAVAVDFLFDPMCENEILAQLPSPDGTYKAIVFQRDCGATTGFSTQVSILRSWHSLGDDAGNTFVADTNQGSAPSGPGGGPEVQIQWLSPTALAVSRHRLARVFFAMPHVGKVQVSYKQLPE